MMLRIMLTYSMTAKEGIRRGQVKNVVIMRDSKLDYDSRWKSIRSQRQNRWTIQAYFIVRSRQFPPRLRIQLRHRRWPLGTKKIISTCTTTYSVWSCYLLIFRTKICLRTQKQSCRQKNSHQIICIALSLSKLHHIHSFFSVPKVFDQWRRSRLVRVDEPM